MQVYYCALCMCYASTCAMSPPRPPPSFSCSNSLRTFAPLPTSVAADAEPSRRAYLTTRQVLCRTLLLSLSYASSTRRFAVCVCVFAYSHRSCSSHVLRHTRGASHTGERGERVGRVGWKGGGGPCSCIMCCFCRRLCGECSQ